MVMSVSIARKGFPEGFRSLGWRIAALCLMGAPLLGSAMRAKPLFTMPGVEWVMEPEEMMIAWAALVSFPLVAAHLVWGIVLVRARVQLAVQGAASAAILRTTPLRGGGSIIHEAAEGPDP